MQVSLKSVLIQSRIIGYISYTPFWNKVFDFLLSNNCPLSQRLENHRLHVKYISVTKTMLIEKNQLKKLEWIKKVHFKNAYHSKQVLLRILQFSKILTLHEYRSVYQCYNLHMHNISAKTKFPWSGDSWLW